MHPTMGTEDSSHELIDVVLEVWHHSVLVIRHVIYTHVAPMLFSVALERPVRLGYITRHK